MGNFTDEQLRALVTLSAPAERNLPQRLAAELLEARRSLRKALDALEAVDKDKLGDLPRDVMYKVRAVLREAGRRG